MKWRRVAMTLTYAAFVSWAGFVIVELLLPTAVTRLFNPHWFLALFLIGAVWWYNLLIRK